MKRCDGASALFAAVLGVVIAGAVMLCGAPGAAAHQPGATTDHMFRSVTLIVDYGDDVEKRWSLLRWKQDMTALDAMKLAASKPRPLGLLFESAGEGERAFVRSIEGIANEGGAAGARNWMYAINGRPGDRSCGVAVLKPEDTVTWRLATMGDAAP